MNKWGGGTNNEGARNIQGGNNNNNIIYIASIPYSPLALYKDYTGHVPLWKFLRSLKYNFVKYHFSEIHDI